MAAALDTTGILVFTFQHKEDGTINVDKSLGSFFNSIHEWSDDLKDIAMPLFRMVAQLNILCAQEHSLVRCPCSGGDQDGALKLSWRRSAAGRPIV